MFKSTPSFSKLRSLALALSLYAAAPLVSFALPQIPPSLAGLPQADSDDLAVKISAYQHYIADHRDDQTPEGRHNTLLVMGLLATAQAQNQQTDEAIHTCQSIIKNHEADENPDSRLIVAGIKSLLGSLYSDKKRWAEAIKIYDQLISEYKNDTQEHTRVEVLETQFKLASLFALTGKWDMAPTHFQQVIESPLYRAHPELKKYKAYSLILLGGIYQEKSEHGLAIQQFERLLRDFANDNTPEVSATTAAAYAALAAEYSQPEMDQTSKALEIVHHSLFKDMKHLSVKTRKIFLSQILKLTVNLYLQGEHEGIIEIGEKTLTEFGNDSDPAIRLTIADIMLTMRDAAYQIRFDGFDKAQKINQQLISRTEHETDPAQRERYALALLYLIDEDTAPYVGLKQRLQSIDRLINAFQSEDRPSSRHYVARAMRNLAQIHYLQQDNDAAIQTYKTLLDTYGDDTYIGTRREVAESMQNLLMLQLNTQRDAEAASTYQQFMTRFAKDNDPLIEAVANRVKDLMQDREAK